MEIYEWKSTSLPSGGAELTMNKITTFSEVFYVQKWGDEKTEIDPWRTGVVRGQVRWSRLPSSRQVTG